MKKIKICRLFGYDFYLEVPEHLTQEDIDQIIQYLEKKLK